MSDPENSTRSMEGKSDSSEHESKMFDDTSLELEQRQGEQDVPYAQDKITHFAFPDSQRLQGEQDGPVAPDQTSQHVKSQYHGSSPQNHFDEHDKQNPIKGEEEAIGHVDTRDQVSLPGPSELKQVHESTLRTSTQPEANPPVSNTLFTHRKRVEDELMRSRHAIRLLLSQSADWSLLSPEERELSWQETWIRRAQKYETEKIAKYGLDPSEFDFTQTGRLDVLDRQRRVLWRIVGKKRPLSCYASSSKLQRHRAYLLTELNHKQLELLESWTTEWQHLASNYEQISRGASQRNAASFRESRLHFSVPSESTADERHVSPFRPTQMHEQPDGWANSPPPRQYKASANQGIFQLETGQASAAYPLSGSNHDTIWAQPRAQALQSQPPYGGYEHPSIPGSQFVGSVNDLLGFDPRDLTHGSLHGPEFAASPSPANFSDGSATQVFKMPSPGSQSPAPLPSGRRPKKRGAPRLRMFITKPKSDTPLPQAALENDIEVLENFPEHLSLPEVMRRFVRVGRTGGWATERMVDVLEKHPNAKDHPGISEKSRRANLKKWVIKERDRCHECLRKAGGTAARQATPEVGHAGQSSRAEDGAARSLAKVSPASSARVEPMANAMDSTVSGTFLQSPFHHAYEDMMGPALDLQEAEALEVPYAQEEQASMAFGSPVLLDDDYDGKAKFTDLEESVDWKLTFEEIMEAFD